MEIRPSGRITICRLKAKATAGATKAAFSGRSLVAVRNLMLCTIRQAPPWRATLKGSPLRFAPLRSLRDALGGSSRIRASQDLVEDAMRRGWEETEVLSAITEVADNLMLAADANRDLDLLLVNLRRNMPPPNLAG